MDRLHDKNDNGNGDIIGDSTKPHMLKSLSSVLMTLKLSKKCIK